MKVIEQLRLLSDERFLCIYEALVRDGFGPLDGEVAKALKFRPQAIVKIPMAKRAQRILPPCPYNRLLSFPSQIRYTVKLTIRISVLHKTH